VIGKPDEARGQIVKAFIVLQPGQAASQKLIDEIQDHVRGRLAPYEYPREIEFLDALPDDHHRKGAAQGAAQARGAKLAAKG